MNHEGEKKRKANAVAGAIQFSASLTFFMGTEPYIYIAFSCDSPMLLSVLPFR